MSIFSTQTIIPHHSGLLELPASAVSGVAPVAASAKDVVEAVLVEPRIDEIPAHEIAVEAYLLFEARGFEHGHDVEDWLAAEALLRQRRLGGIEIEGVIDPRN